MSNIQLSGLSTGIDTKALVEQLMQVEQRRLKIYEQRIAKKRELQTAVNELQAKLNGFKNALSELSNSSQLKGFKAVSSNTDKLTAVAAGSAHEGSHSVQIKQLATANRWAHSGFKYTSSYVGQGTFILKYNSEELIIQTTSTTTLQDLVNLINNDPENPGITASILKYDDGSGNPYHLVLNGRQSGSDYQVVIADSNSEIHTAASTLTASGANAGLSTKISDLNDFSGQGINFLAVNQVVISGTDRDGSAVNSTLDVNPYTTIADLVEQIEAAYSGAVDVKLDEGQLRIIDKTSGASQMTLSLSFNTPTQSAVLAFNQSRAGGSINASIASLAAANFIETQSAQDALIKVDDYPPGANNWIARSSNTIDDVITGVTLNLHSATANTSGGFDAIEVNLTRDTEGLKSKITAMIDAYNALQMFFDEKTKYDPQTNTSGILAREFNLTSIRSQIRSLFVANATGFSVNDTYLNPRQIGFSFGADGLLKLDMEKFDQAINKDYQGVLSLIGANKIGSSVGGDAASLKFYASSKYTKAGSYNVRVTVDASGNITSAQIKLDSEDWSQARSMGISGNYVYGQTGSIDAPNPETDLQISVDTTQVNRTLETTLTVRQGFAGALFDTTSRAVDPIRGQLTSSRKGIDTQISNLNRRIEYEQERISRTKERLTNRFARLERFLTAIQQQFSGIQQVRG